MNTQSILLGNTENGSEQRLLLNMANRHGLVAGATGTGKTVTLRTLVKGFAERGVTVFAPDVKGDLGDIAKLTHTHFWDFTGANGDQIQISVEDMGATLFARLLQATEAQEGVVTVLFAMVRERNYKLDTLDDVRVCLNYMVAAADELNAQYGYCDARSVMTLQRKLLKLETEGLGDFFGPTSFSLDHLMLDTGVVNILRAEQLINNPALYSTFLLWMLNQLFVTLPEIGQTEKPRMVFFFDEAHLLFDDAPKSLLQMIERVVRLIRSKGVGVYFVSQSPADIPNSILAQLGNRIQHAIRAYTQIEQRAIKATAASFRKNSAFDTGSVLQTLGVGQALVSVLDEQGVPTVVEHTQMHMVAIPANARAMIIRSAPLKMAA